MYAFAALQPPYRHVGFASTLVRRRIDYPQRNEAVALYHRRDVGSLCATNLAYDVAACDEPKRHGVSFSNGLEWPEISAVARC